MPGLSLRDVRKSFGDTLILDSVSLDMDAREFIAFLGPSGSGKSTLLRIIAGLETADAGEVWLDDRRIDQLAPGARDVAMVFQAYALYPHMTVAENMAFGLRNAGTPRDEIARRIAAAAEVLDIATQLDKKPGQLSGGQRQRVAIGRAIVKYPRLFLLDEPLSNLDAALRNRTRVELAQLRHRVEAGVIMVTHDQAEAMTLADRIVVMNDKRVQQVGPPLDVYARPANIFVARFVGSPAMALLPVQAIGGDRHARVRFGDGAELETAVPLPHAATRFQLGLRPEMVGLTAPGAGTTDASVELVERLGDRTYVFARLSDGSEIIALADGRSAVRIDDRIGIAIDGAAAHLFDEAGLGHHPEPRG